MPRPSLLSVFFLLLAGILFGAVATACVAPPRDPDWRAMLAKAEGAVVVKAHKLGSVGEFDLVRLDLDHSLYDPHLQFRGRTIAAVELSKAADDLHEDLAFWAGGVTYGGVHDSTCQQYQLIDYVRRYVLLLSVDRPYALEPILAGDDRWLAMVVRYFEQKRTIGPIGLHGVAQQIEPISYGPCKVESSWGRDDFLACVTEQIEAKRRGYSLLVKLGGMEMVRSVPLLGDPLRIPAGPLRELFGIPRGFPCATCSDFQRRRRRRGRNSSVLVLPTDVDASPDR